MGTFLLLSGPSCIGKGVLVSSLRLLYPDLFGSFRKLVLYNDRAPRPVERDGVDYHFRTTGQIEALRDREDFKLCKVRDDLQAINLRELGQLLDAGDVFFEGNPAVVNALRDCPCPPATRVLRAFVSPLSRDELLFLRDPERHVDLPRLIADIMRRKLLRRTQKQKGLLSTADLANIEVRAGSAYGEMREACRFDYVIPNHDGEDSENWDAWHYPLGDARRATVAVAELLGGRTPACAEHWEEDLLPPAGA